MALTPEQTSLFPEKRSTAPPGFFSKKEIDTSLASPVLSGRRAAAAIRPILEQRLGPALAQAVGLQLGRPGATVEGVLSGLSVTGGMEIGRELSGLQQEILAARQNLKGQVPRAPNVGASTLAGAAGGFLAGGPIGAIAGGVGGLASGLAGKSKEKKAGKNIEEQTAEASRQASPEAFAATAEKVGPAARSGALAGGAGARRAQDLEAAITASGLRDTGIGTLASIAAGIQVPLEGLAATFGGALDEVTAQASRTLAAPIQTRTSGDNITRALEGLATLFLTRGQPGSSAGNPAPAQRIPDNFGMTPPLIPSEGAPEIPGMVF